MTGKIFRVAIAAAWLVIACRIFRGAADQFDTVFGGLACVAVSLGVLIEIWKGAPA